MLWYEILIAIPVIIVGGYIHGKIYEHKRICFITIVGELDENEKDAEVSFLYDIFTNNEECSKG
jgi:hypothetical protein